MRAIKGGTHKLVRSGSLVLMLAAVGCSSKPAGSMPVDGGQDGTPGEAGVDGGGAPIAVLQHHGDGTRGGFYIDPAFTKAALPGIEALPGFAASLTGSVFAQPLYVQGGVTGQDALFVVTEANDVYALQADTGQTLWKVNLGTPEPKSALPTAFGQTCGTISPLGITSTPIIDVPSRQLLVCGMTMQSGVPDYIVSALSLDDGSTKWSVDLNARVSGFTSLPLMQRGALAIQGGVLYIPFGGQAGGCLPFNGWVVGVPIAAPQTASGWHTGASGGGIWAPSGVATDDTSAYVATASPDTAGLSPIWSQSNTEAILRIGQGPVFSGASADYFVPRDWFSYGINGSQLGAAGVALLDMPGSSPSALALAIGKTSDAYLVDRTNLGGVGQEVSHLESATSDWVEGAMAAYTTGAGGYFAFTAPAAFCPAYSDLTTLKVIPGSPPTLAPGWCAVQGGAGSPIATASAAASAGQPAQDVVVWGLGTGNQGAVGDGKLRAFDGDTGAVVAVAPGKMPDLEHWISPIVAKGRIYVVGDKHVYAYDLLGSKQAVAQGSQDAGPDAGPPSSCLLPITPDQKDICAPYGLACLGQLQQVYGKCGQPSAGLPCTAQVGCTTGLDCVTLPGQTSATCQEPCTTANDCSIFDTCGTVDGGAKYCISSNCGPSADAGAYYAGCDGGGGADGGAGGGTCVPFFASDGAQVGECMAAGTDAGAGSCVLARGMGALCPQGSFCFTGASTASCLPLCDYTRATFGVDAGGPSCAPAQTCVLLGGNVPFGVCTSSCDDGGACPSPLTCQLWNPYTNPNGSACLPP